MENFEIKNTVNSENQVSNYVFVMGDPKGSPRILFLGNSITRHGPAPNIGWYGNWGMAASCAENDYVHICMREIQKKHPSAAFCMVQGAVWERSYRDCDFDAYFAAAKGFDPDVIICLISENISNDDFTPDIFIEQLRSFHKYLSGNNENTKIIAASNFFNNEHKTEAIRDYVKKYGAEFVYISDIISDKINLACGYEHEGISIHPGDKGMAIIAERLMKTFNTFKENNGKVWK